MPLSLILLIAFALLAGYAVVVGTAFILTFALTSTVPRFVARGGRMSSGYLFVQGALWLLCSAIGGFVAGSIATTWHPPLIAAVLAVALVAVTWPNIGDTGLHDALSHKVLLSAIAVVGVLSGCVLRMK